MHKITGKICPVLCEAALAAGASAASALPATSLLVEERFADLCAGPKPCPSYGLAPGCPPHAMRPEVFRSILVHYDQLVAFRIDVPVDTLLGAGRLPIARRIHRIAALLEQRALELGCVRARAFASGSCKELFCGAHSACLVLSQGLPCPHGQSVRPSLSAVGVNFSALAEALGWPLVWPGQAHGDDDGDGAPRQMAMLAGLLVLG